MDILPNFYTELINLLIFEGGNDLGAHLHPVLLRVGRLKGIITEGKPTVDENLTRRQEEDTGEKEKKEEEGEEDQRIDKHNDIEIPKNKKQKDLDSDESSTATQNYPLPDKDSI